MTHLKRSGIQLAMPFEERRLLNQGRFQTKWEPPYLMQPKLNGERCRDIVSPTTCMLLSSTEELVLSVPHIQQFSKKYFNPGEYDGEFYVHGKSWSWIHSIVSRTTSLHPDYEQMELHLFDFPSNNAQQLIRSVELRKFVKSLPNGPIKLVPSEIVWTLTEIYNLYDKWIDQGYEGFIIRELSSPYLRRRSGAMMKFKPKERDEYKIVGVYEAISENGTPKGMVGGFNCIDDMGTTFSVGAGKLNHDERSKMWLAYCESQYPIDMNLEVEYQTMSDKNKVPLFSRAVRII